MLRKKRVKRRTNPSLPAWKKQALRQIPATEELLQLPAVMELLKTIPRSIVTESIRNILNTARQRIMVIVKPASVSDDISNPEVLLADIKQAIHNKIETKFRKVINATGIILHTGLGRALLSDTAQEALLEASRHYCNLELDLYSGARGDRNVHIEQLLCSITGAEAALVVNNNAAAVLLALNTLAQDKEVIVSRGHLVEIGGSFRVPEVMSKSGALLIEVGTTNKTRIGDYRKAIGPATALLLRVHTSNFRMLGFVAQVELNELVQLAKQTRRPARQERLRVIEDLGSGALVDLSKADLGFTGYEPTVQRSLKDGADIVTFSGDKLLGGPQAGIIVGKQRLVKAMHKNHLYRALRLDKLRLAALEATLRAYLDEDEAFKKIPVFQMIFRPLKELERLAQEFATRWHNTLDNKTMKVMIENGMSQIGGGSLPTEQIPTKLIVLQPLQMGINELAHRLRLSSPPVIGRIYKNSICLDLRTMQEGDLELLFNILKAIVTSNRS